jgi:hypothetical protein
MSHKSISDKNTSRDYAQQPSLHPQPGEGNACSTRDRIGHLQHVEINPEYEKVLS